jgi:hypothetical protein
MQTIKFPVALYRKRKNPKIHICINKKPRIAKDNLEEKKNKVGSLTLADFKTM